MNSKHLAVAFSAAVALQALSQPVWAESATANGGAGTSVTARLDFQLIVPAFLRLQVGTAGATINAISFSPTTAQIGAGVNVAGVGGDLGAGGVTVLVQGNSGAGAASLTYTTTTGAGAPLAALTDGGINTVPWSAIKVASTGSATIAHPAALADGSAAAVTIAAALPAVFNLAASWTYAWNDGGQVYPAATYTGRVAYKLAQP